MLLLSKISACSMNSFIWCSSAQGSLPGPCGSHMSSLMPPSSLLSWLVSTKPSRVCSRTRHTAGLAGRAAVGMRWVRNPLPCLNFVSEPGGQEIALAKCWRSGTKSCWRCSAGEVRCDSVTCHSWLIGRGETELGQEENETLANETLHRRNSLFTSVTDTSIFTANPGIAVCSTRHKYWP